MYTKLLIPALAVATFFASCSSSKSNNEPQSSVALSKTSVVLRNGETAQITASPASGVAFSSEDNLTASVTPEGLIKGGIIGKTRIIASRAGASPAYCQVEVRPKVIDMPEPLLLFGRPIGEVKDLVDKTYPNTRKVEGENGAFARAFENIQINGVSISSLIAVYIPEDGKLQSVWYRSKEVDILKPFAEYLGERYMTVQTSGMTILYLSKDEKISALFKTSFQEQIITFLKASK